MTKGEFMEKILEKARSDDSVDQYLSILFVSQIPSICSRIEFPDVDANASKFYRSDGSARDKELYYAWLEKHKAIFESWCDNAMPFGRLCEAIYALRNQITHQGDVLTGDIKIVLLDNCSAEQGLLYLGRTLYVSVEHFCARMIDAARNIFEDMDTTPNNTLSLHALWLGCYREILHMTNFEHNEFWNDPQHDLELYNRYYSSVAGRVDEVAECLKNDSAFTIDGLSRVMSERLVNTAKEYDEMNTKLDAEVTKRYLIK